MKQLRRGMIFILTFLLAISPISRMDLYTEVEGNITSDITIKKK